MKTARTAMICTAVVSTTAAIATRSVIKWGGPWHVALACAFVSLSCFVIGYHTAYKMVKSDNID